MKQILLTVFLSIIGLFVTLTAFAINRSDSREIERILNTYGKSVVIEFIINIRYGAITTTVNDEYYGRPRKELVTVNTILRDLEVTNLDTREFEEELRKFIEKREKEEKQLVENYSEFEDSGLTRNLAWCKSWLCDEMRRLESEKNRVYRELEIGKSSTRFLESGADKGVFTPVENDFSIVFPESDTSPNPKIEVDGKRRTYISGIIPMYGITATDVSEIYDILAGSITREQSELENLVTIQLSDVFISQQGVKKGKREEISFKGGLAVMYEYYRTVYLAPNSPSRRPGLHLNTIFAKHTIHDNKTFLYVVSFLGFPENAIESKEMIYKYTEFLNTFNFIEHVDFKDLPATSVSISSTPPGVSLFVDGKKVGNTPRIVELKPGYHMIELRKTGYRTLVETLEIEDHAPVSINFNLLLAD